MLLPLVCGQEMLALQPVVQPCFPTGVCCALLNHIRSCTLSPLGVCKKKIEKPQRCHSYASGWRDDLLLPSVISCLYDDSHYRYITTDNSDLWLFHTVPSPILQIHSLILAKLKGMCFFSVPSGKDSIFLCMQIIGWQATQ